MNKGETWNITYHYRIKKQLKKLRSGKNSTGKKIKTMIGKISVDPFYYGDSFEPVFSYGQDCYSRKTSCGGRIVYAVNKATQNILIISLCGHYGDNGGF